jgi:polysaccharide pyruvyl transferase WcaK-like protein
MGLSIRESHHIRRSTVEAMAHSLAADASEGTVLIPLILQRNQDAELLAAFSAIWKAKGLTTLDLNFSLIDRPSQWLSLLSQMDFVVGMRFHALLMALKSGVPAVGLAYDPKVSYLMKNFEQPCLILAKSSSENNDAALAAELANLVRNAISDVPNFQERAVRVTASQNQLACQNFDVIARILGG